MRIVQALPLLVGVLVVVNLKWELQSINSKLQLIEQDREADKKEAQHQIENEKRDRELGDQHAAFSNREVATAPNLRQITATADLSVQRPDRFGADERRASSRQGKEGLWTDTVTVKKFRLVVDRMMANRWADLHNPDDEDILAARPKSTTDIPKSVLRTIRGQGSTDGLFKFYGGEADKAAGRGHVGGFVFNDTATYDPDLWRWWANDLKAKTVLDVGCGMGISTDFFLRQGMKPTCLEGSHEGLSAQASWSPYLAKYQPSIFHDFSEGDPTSKLNEANAGEFFDVAWSAEFLVSGLQV
jgi:2-polyprenyl-3-methyl-5-hydroxy-6-metoxy-1,4-benzoquinol methylase